MLEVDIGNDSSICGSGPTDYQQKDTNKIIHHAFYVPMISLPSRYNTAQPLPAEICHEIDMTLRTRALAHVQHDIRSLTPSVGTTMEVLELRAEYGAAEYCITARTSQFGERIDQGANPSICVFHV